MTTYILLRWTGVEYTTPGDTIEADPERIGAKLAQIEAERGGKWAAQADDKVRTLHLANDPPPPAPEPAPEEIAFAPQPAPAPIAFVPAHDPDQPVIP